MTTDLPWPLSDGSNLNYVRSNQADLYTTAHSAILGPGNIERMVVPSNFADIVYHFGRPSLFITFTTNPYWNEISRELLADGHGIRTQSWGDRPDLVSRIFKLKLMFMLQELRQNNVFGRYVVSVYTIEFQKRGLPHANILLFLDCQNQFGRIGDVISAEAPDPVANFELFKQYVNCRYVGSSESIWRLLFAFAILGENQNWKPHL
jgi:hypothetical protein